MSRCPSRDTSPLLDHRLWQTVRVGDEMRSNNVPMWEPWLIAASPDREEGDIRLDLPAFGRLRGHLGDPAYSDCAESGRIFVVEEIVASYEPLREYGWWPVGAVEDWVQYSDDENGISLRHPPDWVVSKTDGTTLFESPLWPDRPLELVVSTPTLPPPNWNPNWNAETPVAAAHRPSYNFVQHPWEELPVPTDMAPIEGQMVTCVERRDPEAGCVELHLEAGGHRYVLRQTYATGPKFEPGPLDVMRRIFDSIALDAWPTVTPPPTPRAELGDGPFVTEERAVTQALDMIAGTEGVARDDWRASAELVSERRALELARCAMNRSPDNPLYPFPEAVWAVVLTGPAGIVYDTYIGAVELEHICTGKRGAPLGGGLGPYP
jgi:hypothetical protein